jgi:alpha-glucoside transport system permease protein
VDWFLDATTPVHKLALMVIAIALFAVLLTALVFGADILRRSSGRLVTVLFLGPSVLLLAGGLAYPAVHTAFTSLRDRAGREFVGVDNYTRIFTDDSLLLVLRNTALWVVLVPVLSTVFGLVYAYIVDGTRFEAIARTLIFLPLAISFVGASIIWRFVYEARPVQEGVSQIGIANQILVWLGGEPRQFLLTQPGNTFALIGVLVWIQAGFAMTLLSAAIKAIPAEITEAARLDGVSGPSMLRHVIVPSIRPTLVVVMTTIAIATLKVFDIVRTMTGGQYGTSVLANEFYTQAFRQADAGLGAALAVLLLLLVLPIMAYNVRQLRLAQAVR